MDCTNCIAKVGKICLPNPLEYCTILEFFQHIIDVLLIFSTPIVVLMILVSAFYFIVGGGNPQKIVKAKNIFKYSILGYIVVLLSRLFILSIF